ncbi:MAG: lytic transglycosylase domain-containing protein [Candidatus Nanopelagicales bacterium]
MRRFLVLGVALALVGCSSDGPRVVPKEYRKPIKQAAQECPELTPELLAAQIDQESKFTPDAVSPAGAQGIAQFVPETWQRWGQDLTGDGVADPFNAKEAIDAQARLMCFLIFEANTSGIDGDPLDLALAAYNAGWSQVVRYDGIPPFKETKAYVKRIRDRQGSYVFEG